MNDFMETNKYLWQPRKSGPIHLRVKYSDFNGNSKQFTKSLNTAHWPTARKIRDTEFMPIILDIRKAKTQLDLIIKLFPELEKMLEIGVHGGYEQEKVKSAIPLKSVCEAWSKAMSLKGNYHCSKGTAKRYTSIVNHFIELMGEDINLMSINKEVVIKFRDMRLQDYGKNKNTVSLDITALRSMFNFAMERYGLKENPANGVLIKRTKAEFNREKRQSKRRPPTKEEADELCYNFRNGRTKYTLDDYQDYSIFCRYTGCRQGEVAQLRSQNFYLLDNNQYIDDFLNTPESKRILYKSELPNDKVLCLVVADKEDQSTKTGLERVVPIADKLLPILISRLKIAKNGTLFPFAYNDKGASFGRSWLKKAKLIDKGLTMHGFRHYATSQMENAGCKTSVVCLITGHTKGDVHDGYFHKEVHLLKQAIDTIY